MIMKMVAIKIIEVAITTTAMITVITMMIIVV